MGLTWLLSCVSGRSPLATLLARTQQSEKVMVRKTLFPLVKMCVFHFLAKSSKKNGKMLHDT
jgi:hypothetical protein